MATEPEAASLSSQPAAPPGRDPRSGPNSHARARLDSFARRYYAPLASFFRKRTRNAAEVQDLVQQVFLRLAQHRELDTIQNPDGYIFQTAANTLRDHLRHTAVRTRFVQEQLDNTDHIDSDFSPERVLQGRESVARLTRALRELPERTRDIFMLRCFEGLKHAEIARLEGISIRGVEKQMAKALAYTSQALDEESQEPHDAP
jgi:RNA polymerase sigma-70 factor (ECF subfamily)